jgi:hypothetical protein
MEKRIQDGVFGIGGIWSGKSSARTGRRKMERKNTGSVSEMLSDRGKSFEMEVGKMEGQEEKMKKKKTWKKG